MANTFQLPKTLQEAVSYFSDPQRTFDYAIKLRWPDGKVICPRCNSTDLKKVSLIYAAGVCESRGRMGGLLFGNGDDIRDVRG